MTVAEALAKVNEAGRLGRFNLTVHARQRMRQRHVQWADIAHALKVARRVRRYAGGDAYRWTVDSADVDGDALSLGVDLIDDVLVVTVF